MRERGKGRVTLTLRDHDGHSRFEPWDTDEPEVCSVEKRDLASGTPVGAEARGGIINSHFWPPSDGALNATPSKPYNPSQVTKESLFGSYTFAAPGLTSIGVGELGQKISVLPIQNMDLDRDALYDPAEAIGPELWQPGIPQRNPNNPGIQVTTTSGGGVGSGPVQLPGSRSGSKGKLTGQYDLFNDPNHFRLLSAPLTARWPTLRIAGSEKKQQHPLMIAGWQNLLISDHRSGLSDKLTFSTRVADVNSNFEPDEDRIATVSNQWQVKGSIDFSRGVALTFDNVPNSDWTGGGFFISEGWLGSVKPQEELEREETGTTTAGSSLTGSSLTSLTTTTDGIETVPGGEEPGEETVPPGLRQSKTLLAHLGETFGGIASAGAGAADKHLFGFNQDGEPDNPGHLQLRAPWILDNNPRFDAPPEFSGDYRRPVNDSGVWARTILAYDGKPEHDSKTGKKPGLMKWQTRVPFLTIDPPPFPPDDFPPIPVPRIPLPDPGDIDPGEFLPGPEGTFLPFPLPGNFPPLPGPFPEGLLGFSEEQETTGQETTGLNSSGGLIIDLGEEIFIPRLKRQINKKDKKRGITSFVHFWQEVSSPAYLGRPAQIFSCDRDLRYVGTPEAQQLADDVISAPISIKSEAFGQVADTSPGTATFVESFKAGSGHRYYAPTVVGGDVVMPPELGLERVGETISSDEYSETRRVYWNSKLSFGEPDLTTGELLGFDIFETTGGSILRVDHVNSSGTTNQVATLSTAGGGSATWTVDIIDGATRVQTPVVRVQEVSTQSNYVDVVTNATGQHTATLQDESGTVAYLNDGMGKLKYGDGSDGNVTISSGTTTLTRDMFYSSLTVDAGAVLFTNGYRVFVQNKLTNNGEIHNKGDDGGTPTAGTNRPKHTIGESVAGGVGSSGTSNGTNANAITSGLGGDGSSGSGGDTTSFSGGANSSYTATIIGVRSGCPCTLYDYLNGELMNGGTSGGGGAAEDGSSVGGGGGSAGSILLIYAREIENNGTISVAGGNGGDASGNEAGGGSAGSGGFAILVYAFGASAGTLTAAKGTGGSGVGAGQDGSDGADGTFLFLRDTNLS